jgi:Fic family protein
VEGSSIPGEWRLGPVRIAGSRLRPAAAGDVSALMQELFAFLAEPDDPRYDLIMLALAHHRFAWIHPFDNGNGRTVRLFTYGLLIRAGFRVAGIGQIGRILQPTAIFCSNRDAYYSALDRADAGDDDGLLAWCRYVLRGLKFEIEKIDRLFDYSFLRDHLLLPSINELAERGGINGREKSILLGVARSGKPIANSDARALFEEKVSVTHTSRLIAGLRERKLLVPMSSDIQN